MTESSYSLTIERRQQQQTTSGATTNMRRPIQRIEQLTVRGWVTVPMYQPQNSDFGCVLVRLKRDSPQKRYRLSTYVYQSSKPVKRGMLTAPSVGVINRIELEAANGKVKNLSAGMKSNSQLIVEFGDSNPLGYYGKIVYSRYVLTRVIY